MTTMKHDRKKKLEKRERERLKKREEELNQVRKNALKFYKVTGGSSLDAGLNTSPVTELHACEAYLEELEIMRGELQEKYGSLPEFQRQAWRLNIEISRLMERIIELNIQITAEGRKL